MDAVNDANSPPNASAAPAPELGNGVPIDGPAWQGLRNRLVRLAYRFVWNRDDAEDVAQFAMTCAMEKARDLRNQSRYWSWLSRVVVHRCHEYGRRKQRRRRHEEKQRFEIRVAESKDAEPGLSDATRILPELIAKLPRRQREVLVLRHLQGMSFDEISDVLGISASTARVHVIAAREALRKLIVRRHPDWVRQQGYDARS
jgi:RNA polymerase sigma-70 factor (ECF subfamily)